MIHACKCLCMYQSLILSSFGVLLSDSCVSRTNSVQTPSGEIYLHKIMSLCNQGLFTEVLCLNLCDWWQGDPITETFPRYDVYWESIEILNLAYSLSLWEVFCTLIPLLYMYAKCKDSWVNNVVVLCWINCWILYFTKWQVRACVCTNICLPCLYSNEAHCRDLFQLWELN